MGLLAGALFLLGRQALGRERRRAAVPPPAPALSKRDESPEEYLKVDRLEVAVGFGLIPLLENDSGSDFLDRVVAMRRQLAAEMGILVPKIRIRDDIRLQPDQYEVRVRGHRIDSGRLLAGHHLAMGAPEALNRLTGIATREPAFGLQAKWITGAAIAPAEDLGLTVVSTSVVLTTHLTEVIKAHAAEILSRQDVQALVEELKKESPALVKDVVPELVTLGTLHRVLQNLLRERVPVRDLARIMEILADFAPQLRDIDQLTEMVRAGLSRAICAAYTPADRRLEAITLDPALEQMLQQAMRDGSAVLPPGETQQLFRQLQAMVTEILGRQQRPALVCAPKVRLGLRRLLEASFPTLPVLAYHELTADLEVQAAGVLSLAGKAASEVAPELVSAAG
jgi:flagellar biosynthesis protein FlhA